MRIKVCGLTTATQFAELDDLGVDFGGFIFYPQSPRYVFNHLSTEDIRRLNGSKIHKVGVFVNETIDQLLKMVDECGINMVQLHGDETPHYCEKVAEHVTVIKAFRLRDEDDVLWKIKDFKEVVDMFLFDTATPAYGGSGKRFNWNILAGISIDKPFLLSGGIGYDDVELIEQFLRNEVSKDLFAIDVNSKFELSPGIKNISLIENFLQRMNSSLQFHSTVKI